MAPDDNGNSKAQAVSVRSNVVSGKASIKLMKSTKESVFSGTD